MISNHDFESCNDFDLRFQIILQRLMFNFYINQFRWAHKTYIPRRNGLSDEMFEKPTLLKLNGF